MTDLAISTTETDMRFVRIQKNHRRTGIDTIRYTSRLRKFILELTGLSVLGGIGNSVPGTLEVQILKDLNLMK